MAAAIDYAHKQGIIHRDLKPGNILFAVDGRVVLTDFGIIRQVNVPGQTLPGVVLGTPAYMSPEQAEGQPTDSRSDIYSLGVILYQMATGRLPFNGFLRPESLPLPGAFNPQLPSLVEQVILKALRLNPAERYQSAGEMAQALAAAMIEPPPPPPPSPPVAEKPKLTPAQRRRLERERQDLETHLTTLAQKISGLRRALATENRFEEIQRLQAVIEDNEKLKEEFQTKLDKVEQQLE